MVQADTYADGVQVMAFSYGRYGQTLKTVLEQLGFGPCYHMTVAATDQHNDIAIWTAALNRQRQWHRAAAAAAATRAEGEDVSE